MFYFFFTCQKFCVIQLRIYIFVLVNNDTKHLSKLLTAERGVWNSLSTLTYEQSEAAKYLTIWGKSEGVDINDITEKFGLLITKLSEIEGVLGKSLILF